MQTKSVRLKDANPAVNPGYMTTEKFRAECLKDNNLNRLVTITITEGV